MAYDLEEQEKIDALRAWWDKYGTLCSVVLFAAVLAVLGWRGWQWYQGHEANQAMGYFEALETAAGQPGDDAVARIKAASKTLRSDYASTGYTPRGVLVAAEALQRRNDLAGAREQLEWLIHHGKDSALAALARLRLAGILLQQKQYDQALTQVQNAPTAFAGLYADRRGDILAAEGKKDEARRAWQAAIKALGSDPSTQVIELKIDALTGA
ncbi:MAG TPA: tetratricopeptide repeat protein [Burkholderiaceae bacterium]|nr:tetratricopeptide repeat protein [Burkholderiaceae bacterium]